MTDQVQYAITLDVDHSFTWREADQVISEYVCALCHSELIPIHPDGQERVALVCPEHGDVCQIGRVTRSTVSIQYETAYRAYHEVIRNLPDLWGHLADKGFDRTKAHAITSHCVCAICGGQLVMTARQDDPKMQIVNIKCQTHGNINECGYVEKDKFVYDFNRIRDWNKNHRR